MSELYIWQKFLNIRADVIDWMDSEQGYNDESIAHHLSMDTAQVRMIKHRDRSLSTRDDADPLTRPAGVETQEETCEWERQDFDSDCWETSCDQAFCLTDGTPKENDFKFCAYCGRKLTEKP